MLEGTLEETINGMVHWRDLFDKRRSEGCRVGIGLDPDLKKIPQVFLSQYPTTPPWTIAKYFCQEIVKTTHHIAGFYKPNYAFFLRYGDVGISALKELIEYIRHVNPNIPIILDAKFMDIGNTNEGYVEFAYGWLKVNGVTLHSYFGQDAAGPFTSVEKGLGIYMAKTSNPGGGEFQDKLVDTYPELCDILGIAHTERVPFHCHVAYCVSHLWNANGNCGIVVGATFPEELATARRITGSDFSILIPGGGKGQGGDPVTAARFGGEAGLFSFSREILFASSEADFAEAAARRAVELNGIILKAHKEIEDDRADMTKQWSGR